MVEALVNYWTLQHFFFGIGTSILIVLLLRVKYRIITISLSIISLWEVFQYREYPIQWLHNYGNNVVDIIVGLIGIFLGNKIINIIIEKKNQARTSYNV